MPYSEEQSAEITERYREAIQQLRDLQVHTIVAGQNLDGHPIAREYLHHGVGRRIRILIRPMQMVFDLFPANTQEPLGIDRALDVQVALHAFTMNAFGIHDNWAWAFTHRHQILPRLTSKHKIGLQSPEFQTFLPEPLRAYVAGEKFKVWFASYLKNYRDSESPRIL